MNPFSRFPFVRFLPAFLFGIYCIRHIGFPALLLNTTLTFFCLVSFAFALISRKNHFAKRWQIGLIYQITLFLCGFWLSTYQNHFRIHNHYETQNLWEKELYYIVEATSAAEIKQTKAKFEAKIIQYREDSLWQNTSGKIIVYQKFDSIAPVIEAGQLYLISGRLNKISAPKNPGEFNYREFLSKKHIYGSIYIGKQIPLALSKKESSLFYTSAKIQHFLSSQLKAALPEKNQHTIASALILGEKNEMDEITVDAFSATGTMHVLSVSGLHVGLLFFALNLVIDFFLRNKKSPALKTILLILLLWIYAFITGLSPSVLRSVTMFSMVVIGQQSGMRSNIYNTLAASAFLILCFDTNLMYSAGFQLSYLAVWGIVFLQPYVYNWIYFKNKWLDKIWVLSSVSIAAQLSTLPLSLYYFGIFPNYFLPANLVVIPLATCVLYLGIVYLAVCWIPFLSDLFSQLFSWSVKLLEWLVNESGNLPGAVSEWSINLTECLLLYTTLFFFIRYANRKKFSNIRYAFISILLIGTVRFFRIIEQQEASSLVFYSSSKENYIQYCSPQKNLVFAFTSRESDERITYSIQNYSKANLLTNPYFFRITNPNAPQTEKALPSSYFHSSVLQLPEIRIAVLHEGNNRIQYKFPLKTDLLLISGSPYCVKEPLRNRYSPRLVILSADNKKHIAQRWMKKCREEKIAVYDLNEGYLKINLP